ncbi:NADP-dependent isocitrate dehydrogenase [Brochothrix thermosphacta]|uniref:NADP-dependent isocitrate dehydrogenase n=1 Tax=Brochothrix thermosphacta TaxID=2756 RepID=UPI000ECCACE3|nr:NADP-dependent isocitrate dehydrogenase [Brochothrix thermosphacta]HCZ39267.1 NADP-dependent isocitrate dehydrogenase [Brochothrix thermosphacta]HCZ47026.1 NADP-dependent isocitrate dehydrogenase [Brochothrix thermosphacta]
MTATSVKMTEKGLQVPNEVIVPYIEGDGIGPDIWKASKRVITTALKQAYGSERTIAWQEILAGEKAFNATGEWLPTETVTAIKEHLVALKGPLTTPIGGGIRSLNVALRQQLDLYVCLRPVTYMAGVPSPLKKPENTDIVVFRENTEDIYAGIEFDVNTPENHKLRDFLINELAVKTIRFPDTAAFAVKPVSEEGSERLIRAAIDYALAHKRPSVTLIHKGNIMKFTEGGFKRWGYELAEREYGDVVFTWPQYEAIQAAEGFEVAEKALSDASSAGKLIVKDIITDNFLQQIVLRPEQFDVVATMNLNGDYVSDALAAQVGGIGLSPGANINYLTGHAIFEATHGTAPNFANQDRANPSAMLLSAVMLLEHLGWNEAATLILNALESTISQQIVTEDLAQLIDVTAVSTSAFADALEAAITK